MFHDWRHFRSSEPDATPVVDCRRRLRICLAAFAVLVLAIVTRAAQLEFAQGNAFRTETAKPLRREHVLPGVRGRILSHDGTVLAYDKQVAAVAVQYRWLEEPADARWLRSRVRERLTRAERKDPQRVADEEQRVLAERADLAGRLARLCGLTSEQWAARARQVQSRVERIAESVNARRDSDDRVTIAEESDYHVMAEDLPLAVTAEIEGRPDRYPGVTIVQRTRRVYPAGTLAAHVLGHLGSGENEPVGRIGVERQYDAVLRGHSGMAVDWTDHAGRVLESEREREPATGPDLVLTIDSRLQRTAEELLDRAIERRTIRADADSANTADAPPAGGAIVVIDVQTGSLRAMASAPRFDPNWFAAGRTAELATLQRDKAAPLFDRTYRMAIAPGSVFKPVTAAALLAEDKIDPQGALVCQGYLHQPDRQRCELFVRRGVGHGEVMLVDALCVSCNVYFMHHAGDLGGAALAAWAERFGFGRRTGVDLPDEAAGTIQRIQRGRGSFRRSGENDREEEADPAVKTPDPFTLAIGQGELTATPLQVARMMAAVANGGRLVAPHVTTLRPEAPARDEECISLAGASGFHAAVNCPRDPFVPVREGLERVVADPQGTGHATVFVESIPIAGKTGTAETGGGRAAHAWFAGYVPADRPRLAFVVVLEHAGSGSTAAGPVAKRLVLRMKELRMF
jgi:penicillin-binding protein 2